jgi:hypothetical protein
MSVEVERDLSGPRHTYLLEGMKVSWGGVFGGVLAGLGVLMLLSSLGIAIGLSAVDPRAPDGRTIGIGAAIWTALTLLISLFVAGWASTRLSMLWERTTAMFEGALVWVLSLILVLYLAANGVALVAGGALGFLGNSAKAVGGSAGAALDVGGMASGNVDEILKRLRDPQTASVVAGATGMSQQEATDTLNRVTQRVEAVRNDPARASAEVRAGLADLRDRVKQNVVQTAADVQPEVSATAWVAFASLVLSLLASIGGAAAGRRHVVVSRTGAPDAR